MTKVHWEINESTGREHCTIRGRQDNLTAALSLTPEGIGSWILRIRLSSTIGIMRSSMPNGTRVLASTTESAKSEALDRLKEVIQELRKHINSLEEAIA